MDSDELYKNTKRRFDFARNKQLLREKYQSKLKIVYEGGMWEASPQLITLLSLYSEKESLVLEDLYQNPVKINPGELLSIVKQHWQEQMNAWLIEYENNSKER